MFRSDNDRIYTDSGIYCPRYVQAIINEYVKVRNIIYYAFATFYLLFLWSEINQILY